MSSIVRVVNSALIAVVLCFTVAAAKADDSADVVSVYRSFADAQNARDLSRVRALLIDSPNFLWVTDGAPVWGPDAAIERMAAFQRLDVWRVFPDLDQARTVLVSQNAAFLAMPLSLLIGESQAPRRINFYVSVLMNRDESGWRIAALFTTTARS